MTFQLTPRAEFPPPEAIDQPAIRRAVEQWQQAKVASREASREATALEQTRPQAVAEDREALADALVAGKADPGQPHAEAHGAQLEAAQRFAEARKLVEDRAFAALSKTVNEKLPDWLDRVDKQAATARAEVIQALDELAPRLAALAQALAVSRFVRGNGDRYRQIGAQIDLPRSSESRIPAGDLLNALRQLGSEPEQRPGTPYVGGMRIVGER